jgi:hypothetical protein
LGAKLTGFMQRSGQQAAIAAGGERWILRCTAIFPTGSGGTVSRREKAERGGFMRRFLTLISLLCLAIPAGVSITGCSRDPGANYCNGLGYGMKVDDVAAITLQPETIGISMAFGQTKNISTPSATTCKGASASVTSYSYGTSNNQLVDISPSGNICAGTWNRNSGGGIGNYTICSSPNPTPSTGGLPYSIAYITASAQSIVSNPVPVFVHAAATSVSLVTTPSSGSAGQQCYSQGSKATLDAQVCYAGADNKQYLLCAPSSVTSNYACPLPAGVTSVPSCTSSVGILSYFLNNATIANLASDTITQTTTITAAQPGTTAITASLSASGSSAGFFSTCPPKSISLTLPSGATTGTITQGVTQTLVTKVYDNNLNLCPPTSTNPAGGCPITGMSLTYQSTDPADISVSGGGSVTTSYPGEASLYALCEPASCNPAPIFEAGLFGTGLPVSSNQVTITTPGTASDYLWFGAPGQSQYVASINLLTGAVGSSERLPYVPNSMVMDSQGSTIYFGSTHELMTLATTSSSALVQNTSAPGVVLAVSPDGSVVVVNDQVRGIFYLVNTSASATTSFGGIGNAAAWTPDSQTLYITDNAALNDSNQGISGHTDTLYVYNKNTGWVTYPLPPSPLEKLLPPGVLPQSVGYSLPANTLAPNVAISSTVQNPAITIPSVGAYLRGVPTEVHTWCPSGTVGDYNSMHFYPGPDLSINDDNWVNAQSDVLAATTDGQHILGASATNGVVSLADMNVTIPALNCLPPESDPNYALNLGDTLSPLVLENQLNTTQLALGSLYVSTINRIIASPASNLAFITYTPVESSTNALLPYYQPNSADPTKLGTVGYVSLTQNGSTAPNAPIAGLFTPDDKYFFVSTAGDNMVHVISIPTAISPSTPLTDTQQISPSLPACTPVSVGGNDLGCTYTGPNPGAAIVPATAIAVRPRSTT